MITKTTWPTYHGNSKDGAKTIINHHGFSQDVQYGKTKVFIKSPQTVFTLEETRSKIIPDIVMFLQKVQT